MIRGLLGCVVPSVWPGNSETVISGHCGCFTALFKFRLAVAMPRESGFGISYLAFCVWLRNPPQSIKPFQMSLSSLFLIRSVSVFLYYTSRVIHYCLYIPPYSAFNKTKTLMYKVWGHVNVSKRANGAFVSQRNKSQQTYNESRLLKQTL